MRTAVPNLHLNLAGATYSNTSVEDLTRQQSSPSVPITPVGQVTTNTPGGQLKLQRLNSVSSVGSTNGSDDTSNEENSNSPRNLISDSSWPKNDDDLILRIYNEYLDNPTVAPFAGRIPPSGIVNKVARDTTKQAKLEGRQFPHSISAIRKRLLLLCNREQETATINRPQAPPSRTSSASPLECYNNSSFGYPMTPRRSESPLFSDPHQPPMSASNMLNLWWRNPTPPPTIGPAATDRPLASPFHDCSANNRNSPQDSSEHSTSHIRQPTPLRGGLPPQTLDDEDDDINVTSKRKRDSLKLKRGINN